MLARFISRERRGTRWALPGVLGVALVLLASCGNGSGSTPGVNDNGWVVDLLLNVSGSTRYTCGTVSSATESMKVSGFTLDKAFPSP